MLEERKDQDALDTACRIATSRGALDFQEKDFLWNNIYILTSQKLLTRSSGVESLNISTFQIQSHLFTADYKTFFTIRGFTGSMEIYFDL